MKNFLKLFVCIYFCGSIYAQETESRVLYTYDIKESKNKITVDGVDSENEWSDFSSISEFYNHFPTDKGQAFFKSEVKITYGDESIFFLVKCYDEGDRTVQSLERDSENAHWDSDSFTIAIDPVNRKQSGYMFGVNAGGARVDGSLLVEPSRTTYDDSWDEKWYSSVKQYKDHWLAEIEIPFTSLRYNANNLEWGINFIRGHKAENYYYTWTNFPVNFNGIDVNYMGALKWNKLPNTKRKRVFVKPYTTGNYNRSNLGDANSNEIDFDAGIDIRIGINNSLNADVTFNPDFSNADVDQEQINITRFNIFLPERREFFIENGDLFSSFGSEDVIPFFSRTIGLNDGESIPVIYGARISGNVFNNTRLGVMNILSDKTENTDSQNYTVASINQKIFNRSQIKGLFINRQAVGNDSINDYNRNYGGEFTYISKTGNLNNTIIYHMTKSGDEKSGNYFGISGSYRDRSLGTGWDFDYVDDTYNPELGFVPRQNNFDSSNNEVVKLGYYRISPWLYYWFFSKNNNGTLVRHRPRSWHSMYFDLNDNLNERINNLAYDLEFKNTSSLSWWVTNREVNLKFATTLLGSEFTPLPVGNYNFWSSTASYSSDVRKRLRYGTNMSLGEFYNGKRYGLSFNGNLRFGFWGNFSMEYEYNKIDLPMSFGKIDLNLIKFKSLLSFSNKLFLSSTVQYNSQNSNFSVFSRLQWRYAPLSDIFVIFNQNNNIDNSFQLINSSIILKATYRFGL